MTEEQIEQKSVVYTDNLKPSIGKFDGEEGYSWNQVSDAWLDGYHEGFKDCAKARLNVTTISDCPIKDDWHYVKDEGTPIHRGHYLVCLRSKSHAILDCWISFDKDIGWYSLQVRLVDIYAWKEIVPPKEIE